MIEFKAGKLQEIIDELLPIEKVRYQKFLELEKEFKEQASREQLVYENCDKAALTEFFKKYIVNDTHTYLNPRRGLFDPTWITEDIKKVGCLLSWSREFVEKFPELGHPTFGLLDRVVVEVAFPGIEKFHDRRICQPHVKRDSLSSNVGRPFFTLEEKGVHFKLYSDGTPYELKDLTCYSYLLQLQDSIDLGANVVTLTENDAAKLVQLRKGLQNEKH